MRRFVRYSRPLGEERVKGCCWFPGKCAGVERDTEMRGADVKTVCSCGRGVNGGDAEGESITQLRRC